MKTLLAVLCATALLSSAADEREADLLARGRTCCEDFLAGRSQPVWDAFHATMRSAIGSLEKLDGFKASVDAQLGGMTEILDESVELDGKSGVFKRQARFEKVTVPIDMSVGFDADDRITMFLVRPAAVEAPSDALEYQTKTALRLPFDGEWFVVWGGRTVKENYHAAFVDQRFAYDLLITKDGATHTGDGKRNEDYHCFGQPILAPGQGVVIEAVDGVPDNVPGEMDPRHAAGNHVVIDHGNGEWTLLAHFRKGTLKVAVGARVEAGQMLALCGNSGNSSEPHLHVHMQDGPVLFKARGLPAQFLHYAADGQPVERGEPTKGQAIRSQAP